MVRKYFKSAVYIIASSIILTSSLNLSVYAIDGEYDADFYANNSIYFYNPNDAECVSSSVSGNGSCSVNPDKLADTTKSKLGSNISNANTIITKLSSTQIQGKILSLNQIAAILGNATQESSLDPNASNNGVYLGVWQWGNDRFSNGGNLGDLDSQIDLLIKEMNSGGWADRLAGNGGLEPGSFFEMDDVNELTKKFVADFEGAVDGSGGYQELSTRQQYAKEIRSAIECSENSSSSASTGGAVEGVSTQAAAFMDKYYATAAPMLTKEYGIPWEAVMAQGMLESAYGQSQYARERNNFFGIGAFDSNPDNAFRYATPEEGWRGYADNIVSTPTYRQHGAFNFTTDPKGYIEAIKAAGYATDPEYITKNHQMIDMVNLMIKNRGWESSSEIAKKYPESLENAKKYGQGAETPSGVGSGNTASSGECSTSSGGGLVDGGMNLQQAAAFMKKYYDKSDTDPDIIENTVGAGVCNTLRENCVTFSTYFINKYTSLKFTKNSGGIPGYGSEVVGNLVSRNPGMGSGNTPTVYSVFSYGAIGDTGTNGTQHTGIILGINKSRGVAIIGEANCGMSGYSANGYAGVGAREQSLDSMSGWRFAYLEDHLTGGLE